MPHGVALVTVRAWNLNAAGERWWVQEVNEAVGLIGGEG